MANQFDLSTLASHGGIAWAQQYLQTVDTAGIDSRVSTYGQVQTLIEAIAEQLNAMHATLQASWTGPAADQAAIVLQDAANHATATANALNGAKDALSGAASHAHTAQSVLLQAQIPPLLQPATMAPSPDPALQVCANELNGLQNAYTTAASQLQAIPPYTPIQPPTRTSNTPASTPTSTGNTRASSTSALRPIPSASRPYVSASSSIPPQAALDESSPKQQVPSPHTLLQGATPAQQTKTSPTATTLAVPTSSATIPVVPNLPSFMPYNAPAAQGEDVAFQSRAQIRSQRPITTPPPTTARNAISEKTSSNLGVFGESGLDSAAQPTGAAPPQTPVMSGPGMASAAGGAPDGHGTKRRRYLRYTEPDEDEGEPWVSPAIGGDEDLLPLHKSKRTSRRAISVYEAAQNTDQETD